MKRISSIILLLMIQVSPLLAQEYTVKWGPPVEGFERLLRVDNDGFYCFFSEEGKKKRISPFLVKFDNDLNRVLSSEIVAAGDNVYLNNFFALKKNFVFATSIIDNANKKSDHYISLIDPEGKATEAKHIFTRSGDYSEDGAEGGVVIYPSEDSTHILMYYNPGVGGGTYNFKGQKANETLDFMVMTDDFQTVYKRNISFNYAETAYRTYDFLLSKENKLVTYSHYNPVTGFLDRPFSHEKKRGVIIPNLKFLINIYGRSKEEDKEFELPQNVFKFYINFRMKSFPDGKIYLIALGTNDPYGNAEGIMVCEINTATNSITPKYYKFPVELVQKINQSNRDKFSKKSPEIYYHKLLNVYQNSNGNFIVILERVNGYVPQNISVLELQNSEDIKLTIVEKKQNWKNASSHNSMTDYFVNNRLNLITNDHADNLTSEKLKKFDDDSKNFTIVSSHLTDSGIKKTNLSKTGNDGFHLDTKATRANNNKLVIVTKGKDKHKLGLMELK